MSENDPYPDRIFVRGHFTPHEELLFAKKQIVELEAEASSLRLEKGQLVSEIDHLNEVIKKMKQDALLTKQENKDIRKEKYITDLMAQNKKLKKINRQLMSSNADTVGKLHQLMKENGNANRS